MQALIEALQPLFAPAAVIWGAPVTWLELVAFVLAIAMVVFNIRVNPLGWPLAILSSLLYFALFWDNRLYGDASLQIFFAVIAAWGWWQWLRGTDASGGTLRVRRLTPRARWMLLAHNGERTWQHARAQVEAFLESFAREAAFPGAEGQQEYFVVCDARLNDAAALAAGRIVLRQTTIGGRLDFQRAGLPGGIYWLQVREGALLEPTVIGNVPRNTEMVCEESFGPLAPIMSIRGVDDAIELANATAFGLSSGIVTNNLEAAIKMIKGIRTGTVNVNAVPGYRIESSPFGGVKDSGLGIKEGVVEAIKYMTNVKTFSLPW